MGEPVAFKTNGTTTAGYLARPDGRGPGIIVIQENAFFNDARPEVYDPAAAADAWSRTLAFFRRELSD